MILKSVCSNNFTFHAGGAAWMLSVFKCLYMIDRNSQFQHLTSLSSLKLAACVALRLGGKKHTRGRCACCVIITFIHLSCSYAMEESRALPWFPDEFDNKDDIDFHSSSPLSLQTRLKVVNVTTSVEMSYLFKFVMIWPDWKGCMVQTLNSWVPDFVKHIMFLRGGNYFMNNNNILIITLISLTAFHSHR